MERDKPQRRTNIIFDYWQAQKKIKLTEVTYRSTTRQEPLEPARLSSFLQTPIARLEDLANELLLETFDYLDAYDAYQAFYGLNSRFQSLLLDSTLPLRVNVASMPKNAFQRYHRHMIVPDRCRVRSMQLSNPFMVDLIFSPVHITSHFKRLETLVLDGITSKYLANIFRRLAVLEHLTSLTIIPLKAVTDLQKIYEGVLSLPRLKHCKISLEIAYGWDDLRISQTITSPIEHLIINHDWSPRQLDNLLPHVPQLRRLTCRHFARTNYWQWTSSAAHDNVLTHASLHDINLSFDQFASLAASLFRQMEVLQISVKNSDQYLNANRWQQLITSFMPQLRVFDLQHTDFVRGDAALAQANYESILTQFSSPFWHERHWFFSYQLATMSHSKHVWFYSHNPYKRKKYTLNNALVPTTQRYDGRNDMPMVTHLAIDGEEAMLKSDLYFPRATQLTVTGSFRTSHTWLSVYLKSIAPLYQLTTLTLDCSSFKYEQLVDLLRVTPHIHTLTCNYIGDNEAEIVSIRQTKTFQAVASKNHIAKVTLTGYFSAESASTMAALCPRMQHLTVPVSRAAHEACLPLFLSKRKTSLQHLSGMCVKCTRKPLVARIKAYINSEELLENYLSKTAGYEIYFWW